MIADIAQLLAGVQHQLAQSQSRDDEQPVPFADVLAGIEDDPSQLALQPVAIEQLQPSVAPILIDSELKVSAEPLNQQGSDSRIASADPLGTPLSAADSVAQFQRSIGTPASAADDARLRTLSPTTSPDSRATALPNSSGVPNSDVARNPIANLPEHAAWTGQLASVDHVTAVAGGDTPETSVAAEATVRSTIHPATANQPFTNRQPGEGVVTLGTESGLAKPHELEVGINRTAESSNNVAAQSGAAFRTDPSDHLSLDRVAGGAIGLDNAGQPAIDSQGQSVAVDVSDGDVNGLGTTSADPLVTVVETESSVGDVGTPNIDPSTDRSQREARIDSPTPDQSNRATVVAPDIESTSAEQVASGDPVTTAAKGLDSVANINSASGNVRGADLREQPQHESVQPATHDEQVEDTGDQQHVVSDGSQDSTGEPFDLGQQHNPSAGESSFEAAEVPSGTPRFETFATAISAQDSQVEVPLSPVPVNTESAGPSYELKATTELHRAEAKSALPSLDITQQVAVAMEQVVSNTDTPSVRSISLELQPEELGQLRIHVEQTAEAVTAHIVASESVSSELLLSQKDLLLESLADLGFENASVDITHQQQDSSESGQDSPSHGSRSPLSSTATEADAQSLPASGSGGLNIVV